LLGVGRAQALGRQLEEIVGLVDQNDRKLLADPVREALGGGNGNPHNLSRRAVLFGKASGEERAIELAASPIRDPAGEVTGAVVLLHDVTELRGLHRQMSYQATHDALTGLVNRREFERRMEEAAEVARRGRSHAHVVLPRPRPLQDRQRLERPPGRRQHAARRRQAVARGGARLGHGGAARR
jgi:PAS domain S-box-containing protein